MYRRMSPERPDGIQPRAKRTGPVTRDFTMDAYRDLVATLAAHYRVVPFDRFVGSGAAEIQNAACVRHDVDRRAHAALPCAAVCAELGVQATFYFRYPKTFDADVVRQVASLGHEVGYHYETLTKARGNLASAIERFASELREFRKVTDVRTACMHGSPLSRWDNRDIWTATTLAEHQLVGEPYLSLDAGVGYLTDTGRGWNRRSVAIRDWTGGSLPSFDDTFRVMEAVIDRALPDRIMLTIHPERWNDQVIPWTAELVGQSVKNVAKAALNRLTRETR